MMAAAWPMMSVRRAQPGKKPGTGRVFFAATCAGCGKKGYTSKRGAKRAARFLYPDTRMRVYRCGALWHMTSQDAAAAAQYREWQAGS